MNRLITSAILLALCITCKVVGQDTSRIHARQAVYIELMGTSGGLGVSYDRILHQKNNWKFGARIGMSTITFKLLRPMLVTEAFLLKGKQGKYLELGLGFTYGALFEQRIIQNTSAFYTDTAGENIWLSPRIGYRRQRIDGGTFFRVGFVPQIMLERTPVRFRLNVGLSVGYSF